VVLNGLAAEYRFGEAGGAVYISGPGAKSYRLSEVELLAFEGGSAGPHPPAEAAGGPDSARWAC
jgi:hypothetical protein